MGGRSTALLSMRLVATPFGSGGAKLRNYAVCWSSRATTSVIAGLGMRPRLCPFEVVQKRSHIAFYPRVSLRQLHKIAAGPLNIGSCLNYEFSAICDEKQQSKMVVSLSFCGVRVIDKPNGVSFPSRDMTRSAEENEIPIWAPPNAEEIARAIWQRQRAALPAESPSYRKQWRDQSIPPRFWNEFLLDAHAVLLLIHEKHDDYQNARSRKYRNSYRTFSSGGPLARPYARDRTSS